MTKGIRENLKENNNDLYKKLFISANVNNLKFLYFLNQALKKIKNHLIILSNIFSIIIIYHMKIPLNMLRI